MTAAQTCPRCAAPMPPDLQNCPSCQASPSRVPLHRGNGRIVAGVCAMLAQQFGWNPLLVRVIAVALATISFGAVCWGYLLLWVLTPAQLGGRSPLTRGVDWLHGLLGSKPTPPGSVPTRVE